MAFDAILLRGQNSHIQPLVRKFDAAHILQYACTCARLFSPKREQEAICYISQCLK